jgi:histidine triad (HIT) family protein
VDATDCIFCKIVRGEVPATIVHRDEHVTAFRDLNPQAPTHILIIPNQHISSLSDLRDEDREAVFPALSLASRLAAEEKIRERGYRVVVNTGAESGQSVQHLHFHLLGGRPMRWPPG